VEPRPLTFGERGDGKRAKEISRDAVITLNTLEWVQSDYSCEL